MDGASVDITPPMIAAGLMAYLHADPRVASTEEIIKEVIVAALCAHRTIGARQVDAPQKDCAMNRKEAAKSYWKLLLSRVKPKRTKIVILPASILKHPLRPVSK